MVGPPTRSGRYGRATGTRAASTSASEEATVSVKAMSLVGLDVHARQTHAGVPVPDTGEVSASKLRVEPLEVLGFPRQRRSAHGSSTKALDELHSISVHARRTPRRADAARRRPARYRRGHMGPEPLLRELVEGALARVLVLAPAPQPRAVADAAGRDVVRSDEHT